MQDQVMLVHFMRRGQVDALAGFFPSLESWKAAEKSCFSDHDLQVFREQQNARKLEALRVSYPPNSLTKE